MLSDKLVFLNNERNTRVSRLINKSMLILNRIFHHWHITIITANKFSTFDIYYHQSDLKKKEKAAAISKARLLNLRANKNSKG